MRTGCIARHPAYFLRAAPGLFLTRGAPAIGLARAHRLILPPRRQQTFGDLLLQRPRFLEQRVETPEESSEFLGGEKSLVAHNQPNPDRG